MGATDHRDVAGDIEGIVREATGRSEVRVSDLRRLAGGASREIWAFSLSGKGVPEGSFVLRRGSTSAGGMAGGHRAEVEVLRAAMDGGVPVPRIHWDGTHPTLGDYVIMDRVEGETIARRILRDEAFVEGRSRLTADLGRALAKIHAIPAAGLGFLPAPETGRTPAEAEVERYRQVFDGVALEPHPAIELGFAWLRDAIPEPAARTLVHGDYRMGNVIVGPEGLRAVLDWELAHLGDPVEDLGWLCVRAWRFGNDDQPVAGVGTREQLLEAYERASGRPVSRAHLRFWEVFGNVKWAVINTMQARSFADGSKPTLEMASLGRRTAETELEILGLVEEG